MTDERKSTEELFYGSIESVTREYRPGLLEGANRLSDLNGWNEDERTTYLLEAARTFHDAGIRSQPAAMLHDLVVDHASAPVDDLTKQRWETESRRALREKYGIDAGDRKLANVREFLKDRPTVADLLTATGVGSNPEFVTRFIEHAEKLRSLPTRPAA